MNRWERNKGGATGRDVVRGARRIFPIIEDAPGLGHFSQDAQTIIDQQLPQMGIWMLTLSPITFGSAGTIWPAEVTLVPQPPFINGELFEPGGSPMDLRYTLRWGAGGTAYEAEGVWPRTGQSFTVAADILRLDARVIGSNNVPVGNDIALSAWTVPAQSSEDFLTDFVTFNGSGIIDVFPVPWGARTLYIDTDDTLAATAFNWLTLDGAFIWPAPAGITVPSDGVSSSFGFPVPANARAIQIRTGEVNVNVTFGWRVRLG